MIELSQKTVVEARVGKYGPYMAVGRKQLGQNRPLLRWVFVSRAAAKALNIPNIDDLINQEKEGQVVLHGSQHVVVSRFRGATYIGFHRLDDNGKVIAAKGINLNTEEWTALKCHLPALFQQLDGPDIPQMVRISVYLLICLFVWPVNFYCVYFAIHESHVTCKYYII